MGGGFAMALLPMALLPMALLPMAPPTLKTGE
jgi:hypothetical protein